MDKVTLRRYINIATFLLWLNILVKVVMDNSANLKIPCVLLLVWIMIDTAMDIWDSKEGV